VLHSSRIRTRFFLSDFRRLFSFFVRPDLDLDSESDLSMTTTKGGTLLDEFCWSMGLRKLIIVLEDPKVGERVAAWLSRERRSSKPPGPAWETMAILAVWCGSFSCGGIMPGSASDGTVELAWEARTNRGAPDRYVLLDAWAPFAPSPDVVVLITGRIAPGCRFQLVFPPAVPVDPDPSVVIDGVQPIEDKILNPGLDSFFAHLVFRGSSPIVCFSFRPAKPIVRGYFERYVGYAT